MSYQQNWLNKLGNKLGIRNDVTEDIHCILVGKKQVQNGILCFHYHECITYTYVFMCISKCA